MIRKCAKCRDLELDIEIKAIHVSKTFDLTQPLLEIHIFASGLKAALNVKFILLRQCGHGQ